MRSRFTEFEETKCLTGWVAESNKVNSCGQCKKDAFRLDETSVHEGFR